MSLIIWCAADAAVIRKVIGPIVSQHKISHRVEPDLTVLPHMGEGDVLLACGTRALGTLIALGLVPKGRTVTSMRDGVLATMGNRLFVTFDPGIVHSDYPRLPEIQWDTRLAIRMHTHGSRAAPIGTYRYVESLHEMIEEIDRLFEATGKPVVVAADLETLGLDEYAPEAWIICAAFTLGRGKSDVLYFDRGEVPVPPGPLTDDVNCTYWEGLWLQLHWMFTSPKIKLRGANFKYDSRWLFQKWGMDVSNLKMDTMLVGSLLDENRSNSLKLHAKIYSDIGGYDEEMSKFDKGRMDLIPKDTMLPYAGGDTDATYRISEVFEQELKKDPRLARFYTQLLHPSSKVFEKMERTGVCIDEAHFAALTTELETEIARLDAEMKKLIPRQIRAKYIDDYRLSRSAILVDYMFEHPHGLKLKPRVFTEKTSAPSTAIDHLLSFDDAPEAQAFVKLLKQSNSAAKTLNTFVVGFLAHLRSDGKFHATYHLARGGFEGGTKDAGAVTGRSSANGPAIQTLIKHGPWAKKLRKGYTAPPGKMIAQLDFSQGELKIAACLAEEPVMLSAYANGDDLHAITAAGLNGFSIEDFMLLPEETRDKLRSGAKAANFGLLYGMGANGFKEYAYATYGVKMTEAEAFAKREAFFTLYSRLAPWHAEYKRLAKQTGIIRSPLGRIRHLPLIDSPDRQARAQAERQAVNSPVQSCLSDMMQLAMMLIDREYGAQGEIEMFMMTHDSVAAYIPIGSELVWAKRMKDIMDNLPLKSMFGWDHQLQFTTDAEVSVPDENGVHSLATLKKLKGL